MKSRIITLLKILGLLASLYVIGILLYATLIIGLINGLVLNPTMANYGLALAICMIYLIAAFITGVWTTKYNKAKKEEWQVYQCEDCHNRITTIQGANVIHCMHCGSKNLTRREP